MSRFRVTKQYNGFEVSRVIPDALNPADAEDAFYDNARSMLGQAMCDGLKYSGTVVQVEELPEVEAPPPTFSLPDY
jgi:hypothetical protein